MVEPEAIWGDGKSALEEFWEEVEVAWVEEVGVAWVEEEVDVDVAWVEEEVDALVGMASLEPVGGEA